MNKFTNLAQTLNKQLQNDVIAGKMSYPELINNLISKIGVDLEIDSLEVSVLDRVIDILDDLHKKQEQKEIDKIDNLA